ncbi:succinate dehydrogenase, cytochrome b556 subunit [Afipia massiliensis]|uniref:Succinate dehydrogenase cytochrome b556 subunit n=1 Tax=Afipia massiliensis TaxID=211460 RepID=A0A4U6BLN6_9BRAD|nr:succinate dehydrogenase, cytochrome b556 subunit [Afipia massiliensis]MDZ4365574.1 succinate dehydrogenase, cytochrome b556 subunit [Afipia sp.]TKT71156.1 succinate dehydrogenase, cytochrome b556 subunit [Afipia massiliensis]
MAPRIDRPLSPFMTYRWTLTMAMSIVHRITGIALYVGTLLMAWWLIATASGPGAYANIQGFTSSWIGRVIVFGYTWALLHHMLGGIRHFIWDLGYGFGPSEREWLTRAALIGSVTLTIVVWVVAFAVGGGR